MILYTLFGIVSIILWSTGNYTHRKIAQNMGIFFGIGLSYTISGLIGIVINHIFYRSYTKITKITILIYSVFIISTIALSLTFTISPAGDVLLQLIVINYMWPIILNISLLLVLNFKARNKILLTIGIITGIFGIVIACVGFNFQKINFVIYVKDYYYCYIYDLISVGTWVLYSILLKKHTVLIKNDHTSVSMFLTGIISIIISFIIPKYNNYNNISYDFINILCFIYETIIISYLTYFLWSLSTKYGNLKFLNNFGLLAPIMSVLSTSLYYEIPISQNIIYATIILITSSFLCNYSIIEYDKP